MASYNQIIFKDDDYLLGKSDENNDDFNIILFVCRDIDKISIPPNFKIICTKSENKKLKLNSDYLVFDHFILIEAGN